MNWLAILRALLGLASSLTTYLQNKQLIEAGEAQAIVEGLKNAQDAITRARKARRDAVADFDKHDGMPDNNDPNLRD
jgi:hypothetical protein